MKRNNAGCWWAPIEQREKPQIFNQIKLGWIWDNDKLRIPTVPPNQMAILIITHNHWLAEIEV